MRAYCLSHLADAVLLRQLIELVAKDRATTADLLAHIAEVDERRLYVPAGYASMHAYCVEHLRLSEDAAYKRIQAARAARKFPALFEMLASGKLHLAGMGLIAPHLTSENAGELMRMAMHRRKSEIEQLLAQRFGQPERPATLRPISAIQLAPGQPNMPEFIRQSAPEHVAAVGQGVELVLGRVEEPAPLQPERYELRVTFDKSTRDMLQHAQELLSHCVPGGDVAQVMKRALEALITQLEKRKFAANSKPRTPARAAESPEQRAIRRRTQDVFMGLRHLGVGPAEARHAAECSDTRPEATLEEHMRAALRFIAPKVRRIGISTAMAIGPSSGSHA